MGQKKRILFTGGSGKAGRHVVPYLLDQGHRVVNVDLQPLDHPGVDNLTADITDSGQMFNVTSSYANFDELEHALSLARKSETPPCIIADPVKGSGISFMEEP